MTKQTKIMWSLVVLAAISVAIPFIGATVLGLAMAIDNAIQDARYSATQVRPTEQELIGTYSVTFAWGAARLVFEPDHTFRESISESGKQSRESIGRWSSCRAEFGTCVVLSPFIGIEATERGATYPDYTLIFSRPKSGKPSAKLKYGSSFIMQTQ